ncbi:MAG: dTDP-4-dehydrorhamnose reductase [Candidatus Aenigmatarchaeota archaeon]
MKILVTGSSGLLGIKVIDELSKNFDVIPSYSSKKLYKEAIKMDVTSWDDVKKVFSKVRPDVVVHTAAMTNVDSCEIDKRKAWVINAAGTKNVAEACKEFDSKLIYISTDYVFDGEKGMYKEEDKPNPINYYGFTKLKGEEFVQEICSDWLILRTSTLYGAHPSKECFVTWVIKELKKENEVRVVTDQFTSPTLTNDLAKIISKLIKKDEKGVFHTAGSERISRYNLAIKISEIFDLNRSLIRPITSKELEWEAKRPKDSSFDVTKISKIKKPLNIEKGLKILRGELT